jgi:hypothetical protein
VGDNIQSPGNSGMAKSSKRANGKSATIPDQKLDRGEGGELHQIAEGAALRRC